MIIAVTAILGFCWNIRPDGSLENSTTMTTAIQIICFTSFLTSMVVKSSHRKLTLGMITLCAGIGIFFLGHGLQQAGFFERMYAIAMLSSLASPNTVLMTVALILSNSAIQTTIWQGFLYQRYFPATCALIADIYSGNSDLLEEFEKKPATLAKKFGFLEPVTVAWRRCFTGKSGTLS